MTKKKKQADDPILTEAPTVEIAGETYTVQRLGFRHVFKVARIIGNGVAVLGDTQYSSSQIMQVLVASMTRAEDEVLSLIADLIGVERRELDDPEKFPMDSFVDVLEVVAESSDLRAFLSKAEALTTKIPDPKTA